MRKQKDQLIISKEDHQIIMSHIRNGLLQSTSKWHEAEALEAELKRAKLVEKEKLPADVVCLNSTVTIEDEIASKVMELTLVTPEMADIKRRHISILSPVAAALIGFRKGMSVAWKVPAGMKTFRILDVRKQLKSL